MPSQPAPLPFNEVARIAALEHSMLLDTEPELDFDDIVKLATRICKTPIALVSLIDTDRQWFKAAVGITVKETPRDIAFCAHTILDTDEVLVIEDATKDSRFNDNPLVVQNPTIRFYAGAPIVTKQGHALGTVCVIDVVPRIFSEQEKEDLQTLARQTAQLIQLRKLNLTIEAQRQEMSQKVIHALGENSLQHAELRQNQRLDVVGQMTSELAHDFNNLLQSINSSLFLIQYKSDSADIQRLAESGLSTIVRGTKLVNQLLVFSKKESPQLELIEIASHISKLVDMLTRVVSSKIQLQFDLQSGSASAVCNATQLDASLLNLVINARDAMNDQGQICIATRVITLTDDKRLPDGSYVELTVRDTGPGMTPTVAKNAFEPFFTTKGLDKGTGLGLSQVAGFALKSGGAAFIKQTNSEGTTIAIQLQVADLPSLLI